MQRISSFAPFIVVGTLAGCDGRPAPTEAAPGDGPTPGAPASVLATLGANDLRVDVVWPDTSSNESSFRVFRRGLTPDNSVTGFQQVAEVAANLTTFSDSVGLLPWTRYQYQVRACSGPRCSAAPVSGYVAVTARPAGLESIRWAPNRVRLSWAGLPAGTTDVEVERRQRVAPGSFDEYLAITRLSAPVSVFMDSMDVTTDSAYRYRVRACNGPSCSRWVVSNLVTRGALPAPPATAYAAVSRADAISILWTGGSFPMPHYYLLERRERLPGGSYGPFRSLGEMPTDRSGYVDGAGLTEGATYQYRVSSCGGRGCAGRSTEDITLRVGPAPLAPQSLSAAPMWEAADRVRLVWTDGSSNEVSFRIYRRTDRGTGFGPYSLVAERPANTTESVDTTSDAPWAAHQYVARACNAAGCSPPSPASGVVTLAQAPSQLDGERYSPGRARITWLRGQYAARQDRYEIQRRRTGTAAFAAIGRVTGAQEGYLPEIFLDSVGLVPLQDYEYRVRGCRASFCTPWSAVVGVAVPPSIPSDVNLRAETVSPTALELSWSIGIVVPTHLLIQRRQRNGDGTYTGVQMTTEVPVEPGAFVDRSLIGGATYAYQVVPCNGRGCGTPTLLEARVQTGAPVAPPAVGLNQYSIYTLEVSWLDVNTNETLYRIDRRTNTGNGFTAFAPLADLPRNSTYFVEQGLPAWAMYQYQLRACNPEGCSPGVVTDLRTTAQIRGAYTRTSGESATISWTLTPSEGATRVEIRRRTLVGEAYGPMEDLGQVPASPASFTDSGLSPGAQYRYHIRGCQGSVCTEWENGRSI